MTHVRKSGMIGSGRAERLASTLHWFGSIVDGLAEQLPWNTPGALGHNERADPNHRNRGRQTRRHSGRGPANGAEITKPLGKLPLLPTPIEVDRELKEVDLT